MNTLRPRNFLMGFSIILITQIPMFNNLYSNILEVWYKIMYFLAYEFSEFGEFSCKKYTTYHNSKIENSWNEHISRGTIFISMKLMYSSIWSIHSLIYLSIWCWLKYYELSIIIIRYWEAWHLLHSLHSCTVLQTLFYFRLIYNVYINVL